MTDCQCWAAVHYQLLLNGRGTVCQYPFTTLPTLTTFRRELEMFLQRPSFSDHLAVWHLMSACQYINILDTFITVVPPGGDTRMKKNFVAEFTKKCG